MTDPCTVLLVEDEPLILMDLTFAVEDAGMLVISASSCREALTLIDRHAIDAAVLDVNLGGGDTCEPIARKLEEMGVPFFLHSGDLDRQGELLDNLNARIIPKPASSEYIASEVHKLACTCS